MTNRHVFEALVLPILDSFVDGINGTSLSLLIGTVMMYGPTGAGKTFTMLGSEQRREKLLRREADADLSFMQVDGGGASGNSGVLLYSMDHIFKRIKSESEPMNTLIVKCSYIEIYNDNIHDLLQEKGKIHNALAISEIDSKEFIIKDAVEPAVSDIHEALAVITKGESRLSSHT